MLPVNRNIWWLRKQLRKIDWNLFVFLILFVNVKLLVKIVALVFIYTRKPNLRIRFSKRPDGVSVFYPAMILIALLNSFITGSIKEQGYWLALLFAIAFWMICILVLHQWLLTAKNIPPEKIHAAIFLFFIANAAVSLTQLGTIMAETHVLNPYRYQGMYQKYFISTGDYIRGISFDTSVTNATFNAFGVVYFLSRKKIGLSLLCMIVLLLCCSNVTNLLIIAALVLMFLFRSDKTVKSIILVHVSFLVIFLTNVSPANNAYSEQIFEKAILRKPSVVKKAIDTVPLVRKPDYMLTPEDRKRKMAILYLDSVSTGIKFLRSMQHKPLVDAYRPVIPKENIHAPDHQHKKDTSEARWQAIVFMEHLHIRNRVKSFEKDSASRINPPAGKLIAYQQLWEFMHDHPRKMITGNGVANFSSKLAFRATGLKIAGGYPSAYIYINPDFAENHLAVYLAYYAKESGYHSVVNTPDSVYLQLAGEYGLVGLICFLLFYVGYFARSRKKLTYGIPLLALMLGSFFIAYWFEQLSVVVLFELLMLVDINPTQKEVRDYAAS